MLKRIALVLTLAAGSIALNSARAQQQPAQGQDLTPEQQAMADQLQAMRDQALTNMQNQGIDPQQFANQLQQQMQNGTLDPQALQQQLIDQGIISQGMMDQMQGTIRNLALSTIRRQLGSTDEEWAVVQTKLQRVVAAMSDAEQDSLNRIAGRMMGGTQENTPMEKARKDLAAAVADPNVSVERLTIVLDTWRHEHEKAKVELAAARADLVNILTLRQEAILLGLGVL